MFFDHDVVGNGEAESGPLADRLGGEEGFEDALADLFGYPFAVVFDFKPDMAVLCPRAQRDGAVGLDGLRRMTRMFMKT